MSGRTVTLPRRGLADADWHYRGALDTNVAETFEDERRRLALLPSAPVVVVSLPARSVSVARYKHERSWQWSDRVIALLLVCVIAAISFGGL